MSSFVTELFRMDTDKVKAEMAKYPVVTKTGDKIKFMPATSIIDFIKCNYPLCSDFKGTNWTNFTYFIYHKGKWRQIYLGIIEKGIIAQLKKLDKRLTKAYTSEVSGLFFRDEIEHQILGMAQSTKNNSTVGIYGEKEVIFIDEGGGIDIQKPDAKYLNKVTVRHLNYNTKVEPKEFLKWLDWFCSGDKGMINLIREIFGLCLTPMLKNHFEPYIFFLYGEGRNGKSTLLQLMRYCLGHDNCCAVSLDKMTDDNSKELFEGCLLNLCAENKTGDKRVVYDRLDYNQLKGICDGEPQTIRPIYRTPRTIYPIAKHIFAMNQLPSASEDTTAWAERLIIIPTPPTIPLEDRDPTLFKKFKGEAEGIVKWAITGLIQLIQRKGHLKEPARTQKEKDVYFAGLTSVGRFISEIKKIVEETLRETGQKPNQITFDTVSTEICYSVITHEWYMPRKDLFFLYQDFCEANGYRFKNKSNFLSEMDKLRDVYIKTTNRGVVMCIRMNLPQELQNKLDPRPRLEL